MSSSIDKQQRLMDRTMSKDDRQRWWVEMMWQWAHLTMICVCDECVEIVSCNCKSKRVLLLRLGYLKPFLAGSKKTRQGPRWRVGALCISRCWFYLTVVAIPKQIQKDYKIIWCCVLLCYGSCYDFMMQMLMIYKWWSDRCLWNDYANGRIMHWWISCWLSKLKK